MGKTTRGIDLIALRWEHKLKVKDVAQVMGISSARVSKVERSASVTPDMEARYRAAVRTLTSARV